MRSICIRNIVKSGLCIGCGSCVAQEGSVKSEMQFDKYGFLTPVGNPDWLETSSDVFRRTCTFSPSAKDEDHLSDLLFPENCWKSPFLGRFIASYAGYVAEDDYREQGSSGGMVSWVASELMRKGLIDGVAHVVARDLESDAGYFKFRISHTEAEIREGAKSRYYPVELSGILKAISEVPGRYAVVAVPCMIKAINLLKIEYPVYRERICFTLGLFCGHMKSARFIESMAWQMNVPLEVIRSVDYRHKDPHKPANLYNAALYLKNDKTINKDWWHLADGDWGAGFFMNPACNFCDDVVAETADISFGDAWIEPYTSDGKGTNIIIVRSQSIHSLINEGMNEGKLNLEEVTHETVISTQASGFRQRREGLAYRLTKRKKGIVPVKRVDPDSRIKRDRKRIYDLRYMITKWSHRVFRMSRNMRWPSFYLLWARSVLSVYHGIAYHHGKISEMRKRFSGLSH